MTDSPAIRVALYARYSSDRQNERSIADQVHVLTQAAERRGWAVVASYMDAAISGRAMANRPGLLNAIAAAERGEFDALLVEDEDRIARDEEHQWHVFNRLGAVGVGVSTLAVEQVTRMQVAFKSFMAAEYVQVLSQKTKRGMAANADKGLATGSRLYGYRSEPGGHMEIVPDQAEVIRRIFTLYADHGHTPRSIAEILNAERIPSPSGGLWNASTIQGSAQRANGVLHSEIYAGVKVFGRVEIRKDRATGGKITICKPPEEHKRVEVPHLAIIDRALWDRVAARRRARTNTDPAQLVKLRRRPGLLTGLVKCGRCGASYTSLSQGRLICAGYRERGPSACSNNRNVRRSEVEERVLTALRERLLSPRMVAEYVRAYHAAWTERSANLEHRRRPLERRLAEAERAIERGASALLSGDVPASVIGPKLAALEKERDAVAQELADLAAEAPPPVQLHPRAAENYAQRIADFQTRLAMAGADSAQPAERELVDSVRDMIERIDIEPISPERGSPFRITLQGQLARFVRPMKGSDEAGTQYGSKVVVGGGIEPPTCGL